MNKNKGFSLVELIVVVAIMAVLIGVLAPAYLSYVEKSRKGVDEDLAAEIARCVEIAFAEVDVYDEYKGAVAEGLTLTWTEGTALQTPTGLLKDGDALAEALSESLGADPVAYKSKTYAGTSIVVQIKARGTYGVEVTCTISDKEIK